MNSRLQHIIALHWHSPLRSSALMNQLMIVLNDVADDTVKARILEILYSTLKPSSYTSMIAPDEDAASHAFLAYVSSRVFEDVTPKEVTFTRLGRSVTATGYYVSLG